MIYENDVDSSYGEIRALAKPIILFVENSCLLLNLGTCLLTAGTMRGVV